MTAAKRLTVSHGVRSRQRQGARLLFPAVMILAGLAAPLAAHAEHALVVLATSHNDPSWVGKHVEQIESRPFDGMVINDYLGRNLINTKLKNDSPNSLDASGAVSYEVSVRSLAPLKGAFKKFRYNFVKVNFNLVGAPPLLNDDAGWQLAMTSATNYARAIAETGLKGIFLDNETYLHPPANGKSSGDYWLYEDQIAYEHQSPSAMPLAAAYALARRRGHEFMVALTRGYPGITVIVAHGPNEGCESWKQMSGHFAHDRYLSAAFAGGMIDATGGGAKFVDGGEDYDLHSARDFEMARGFRKGGGGGGITRLGAGKCPFMDETLAQNWNKVSVGFSVFDKERARPGAGEYRPIESPAEFHDILVNALRSADEYTWLYTQWQDWFGDSGDDKLRPYVAAIEAARRDAGMRPQ